MAIFGTYYTVNMLRTMKWPRKQGMLGKEVYDLMISDTTVDQMLDWGACLGAGKPKLALEILAYEYKDRDWSSDDAPNIVDYANMQNDELIKSGKDLNTTAPHDLLESFHLSKYFKKPAPSNVFAEQTIKQALEQVFIDGLIYGLAHPDEYESWYENYLTEFESNKETYKKMELDVEELPSLDDSYDNAVAIIDAYREDMDVVFPEPPKELVQAVRAIRNT